MRRRHRRWLGLRLRWWVLGGAVVVIGLGAWTALRYVQAVKALTSGRSEALAAEQLLTGNLSGLDQARLQEARADLEQAAEDFGARSAVLADGWMADIADHLPGLGVNVTAARSLRTAGEGGAKVGIDVVTLVEKVLPASSAPGDASIFQRLVQVAEQDGAQLAQTTSDLSAFSQALAQIPQGSLLGPLDDARTVLLDKGDKIASAAGPAITLLKALPAAAGTGTHTYLLLLANPGEERPGGGFIGEVGVITVSGGAITAQQFLPGSYFTPLVTDIPPPAPLAEHLFGTFPWDLEDANWSPDFATSAAEVETFYQRATGQTVDGVLDIDPVAMSYVLQVLGPITAPPYPQTITAANILMELNYLVNLPGGPGKAYFDAFGNQMVHDLLHAPLNQMPALASALQQGAREKHIAMYFNTASLEKLVTGANYGGAVTAPLSDSLLVTDANLSGTKGDLFVTRQYSLSATVQSNGNVNDQLVLSYQNPTLTNPDDLYLDRSSGGDYRDYVQVYVPETATLSKMTVSINGAAAQQVAPETVTWELGREAIAYWLVVPYGGSATLTVDYSGPFADISVSPEHYALLWEKQVNALTWPVKASVTMPNGRTYRWAASLVTDRSWSVSG